MPTPKSKVKVNGITKDPPLYHAMNMLMSRFDRLDERFGIRVTTLPHDAYTSGSPQLLVYLNTGCHSIIIIIRMSLYLLINLNMPLRHLKLIGPI
jgi:hypothetical protein